MNKLSILYYTYGLNVVPSLVAFYTFAISKTNGKHKKQKG
jgi:hypothetical protein